MGAAGLAPPGGKGPVALGMGRALQEGQPGWDLRLVGRTAASRPLLSAVDQKVRKCAQRPAKQMVENIMCIQYL